MTGPRIWVVTGAGGRLGKALIAALLEQDQRVIGVFRKTASGFTSERLEIFDPLRPSHPPRELFAVYADLTDTVDLHLVVDWCCAKYGTVDVLVNAAVHSRWGGLLETARCIESFDQQFRTNVFAPLQLAVAFAKRTWSWSDVENRLRNRHILNISSLAGVTVYPGCGQSVYSASKAALNFLTLHMASEFKMIGIRANAIAPNSFPSIVSTELVVQEILKLDGTETTGALVLIDKTGVEVC